MKLSCIETNESLIHLKNDKILHSPTFHPQSETQDQSKQKSGSLLWVLLWECARELLHLPNILTSFTEFNSWEGMEQEVEEN